MKIDAKLVLSIFSLVFAFAVLATVIVRRHDADLAAQQSMLARLAQLDKQVALCSQQITGSSVMSPDCDKMGKTAHDTFGDDILIWFAWNVRNGYVTDNNAKQVEQSILNYANCSTRLLAYAGVYAEKGLK